MQEPGNSDVSAWVDFSALRQAVQNSGAAATMHGPVPQGRFLHAMGMEEKLDLLLEVYSLSKSNQTCTCIEYLHPEMYTGTPCYKEPQGRVTHVLRHSNTIRCRFLDDRIIRSPNGCL